MPKLIANVSVTVIRDSKRISTGPGSALAGKPFNYTDEEVKTVTAQMANAFRKPVNESAAEPQPDDATAPGGNASPTATDTPERPEAETAAKKSATSKKATKSDAAPKSTKAAPQASQDEDDDEDEDI